MKYVVLLVITLTVSTGFALPGSSRAPQCPEKEVGNTVFFPDPTNCQ